MVQHLRKLISSFYKDHLDKPTATSPTIDIIPPMAQANSQVHQVFQAKNEDKRQDTLRSAPRRASRRAKRGNKEEAIKKNPSQCSSKARSWRVAGNLSPWRKKCWRAYMVVDHWHFNSWKNYTATYFDQVPYHPSLSLNKSVLENNPYFFHHSRFFLPCLAEFGRFFHWQYLHSMIFQFSSPVHLIGWEVFHQLIPYPVFFLSFPIVGLGGFLSLI